MGFRRTTGLWGTSGGLIRGIGTRGGFTPGTTGLATLGLGTGVAETAGLGAAGLGVPPPKQLLPTFPAP